MKIQRAVYAGSFDPLTYGHLDIINRGSDLFDELIIAIGENPQKKYLLSVEHRIEILRQVTTERDNVSICSFQGLLVEFCKQKEANIILRGLRAVTDFEFEFQIGLANMDMAPQIETVFLIAEPKHIFISSSLVKEIAMNDGNVERYLPQISRHFLLESLKKE